jgi:hypothetical protein
MIYLLNCKWVVTQWQYYSTHLNTNSTQNDTKQKYIEQHKHFGRVRAVPRLCELYPGICLTTEEKARKTLGQGSRRVPAGTMKIHKHIYHRSPFNTPLNKLSMFLTFSVRHLNAIKSTAGRSF